MCDARDCIEIESSVRREGCPRRASASLSLPLRLAVLAEATSLLWLRRGGADLF
jgi:hypothetical protein